MWAHKILFSGYLWFLVSAAVKVMPLPGTPFHFYTFFYDWLHQFLNTNNTRLSATPTIAPPAPQPETKHAEV